MRVAVNPLYIVGGGSTQPPGQGTRRNVYRTRYSTRTCCGYVLHHVPESPAKSCPVRILPGQKPCPVKIEPGQNLARPESCLVRILPGQKSCPVKIEPGQNLARPLQLFPNVTACREIKPKQPYRTWVRPTYPTSRCRPDNLAAGFRYAETQRHMQAFLYRTSPNLPPSLQQTKTKTPPTWTCQHLRYCRSFFFFLILKARKSQCTASRPQPGADRCPEPTQLF